MQLEAIRIQNFKSLKDVTIDLQQVNLCIGPNNSGKSNLLQALQFLSDYIMDTYNPNNEKLPNLINKYTFQKKDAFIDHYIEKGIYRPIIFTLYLKKDNEYAQHRIDFFSEGIRNDFIYRSQEKEIRDVFREIKHALDSKKDKYEFKKQYLFSSTHMDYMIDKVLRLKSGSKKNSIFSTEKYMEDYLTSSRKIISYNFKTYAIRPKLFTDAAILTTHTALKGDASNLVSFLDYLQQSHRAAFQQLESDLHTCIADFKYVGTPTVSGENGQVKKKIQLTDVRGVNYSADELSEGTLYFLALLAIIHQPNPPKFIMLEEPEKGIHPRRIQELMNYIFELAETKDIHLILTTHSTFVVDEFADNPESVWLFDMKDGATQIKNLQTDVIDVYNQKMKEQGLGELELKGQLSDHWISGLLGGVPELNIEF